MEYNQDLELLEVYTEDNETRIGIAERGVVHYCNLWHREVACWIVNEKNEILLQRRSPNKKQCPNKISITAGHLDLNETPIQATLREVAEEVGIDNIKEEELIYLDTFKCENKNNNHYKYVYLLKTDKKIEDMKMQKSEVSELMYVNIEKLREMIKLDDNELTFAKQYYTPIILNKIEGYYSDLII